MKLFEKVAFYLGWFSLCTQTFFEGGTNIEGFLVAEVFNSMSYEGKERRDTPLQTFPLFFICMRLNEIFLHCIEAYT